MLRFLDTRGGVSILVGVKRVFPAIAIAVLLLPGCKSEQPVPGAESAGQLPPMDNEVVATVRGEAVTLKDLQPVLLQAYGLNVLLAIVQRDLAKHEAAQLHIVVTPQDVDQERTLTLVALKKAALRMQDVAATTQPDEEDLNAQETQQLLDQVLAQQRMSRAEFDIVMETNAYLRKMAEPQVTAQMTEQAVRNQFNVTYGEKVLVHYIVCGNMEEVAQVRRELAAGKSFEDVARARSRDRASAATGGELPPFTLQDNRFPPEFRQVAFLLKKGQVSDPVQIKQYIYIVKLVDRIPPEHAKFEDYRDAVRRDLYQQSVQAAMAVMRQRLGQMALESLSNKDPVLREQWEERVARKDGQIRDMQEIRHHLDREHAPPTTLPAFEAPGGPAAPPATQPATAP